MTVIVKFGKKNKEFNCIVAVIIKPRSTLQFKIFGGFQIMLKQSIFPNKFANLIYLSNVGARYNRIF